MQEEVARQASSSPSKTSPGQMCETLNGSAPPPVLILPSEKPLQFDWAALGQYSEAQQLQLSDHLRLLEVQASKPDLALSVPELQKQKCFHYVSNTLSQLLTPIYLLYQRHRAEYRCTGHAKQYPTLSNSNHKFTRVSFEW